MSDRRLAVPFGEMVGWVDLPVSTDCVISPRVHLLVSPADQVLSRFLQLLNADTLKQLSVEASRSEPAICLHRLSISRIVGIATPPTDEMHCSEYGSANRCQVD